MKVLPYEDQFPPQLSKLDFNRYRTFILTRKRRVLSEHFYTERHHILPRSFGGSNHKDNLIFLTAREHFIAHLILWKAFRESMTTAFMMMCTVHSSNQQRYINLTSRQYEVLKEDYALKVSKRFKGKKRPEHSRRMRGENNPFFGKDHSDEFKKLSSRLHKGKKLSEEHIEILRKANTGIFRSEETKKKMGAFNVRRYSREVVTRMVNPKTNKVKWIPNDEVSFWAEKGWVVGGFSHSKESKQKISQSKKGHSLSDETKEKISQALIGREFSEVTLRKMSASSINRLRVYKGDDLRYIKPSDLDDFLSQGYVLGNQKMRGHNNPSSQRVQRFIEENEQTIIKLVRSSLLDREIQKHFQKLQQEIGPRFIVSTVIDKLIEGGTLQGKEITYQSSGKKDKKTLVRF